MGQETVTQKNSRQSPPAGQGSPMQRTQNAMSCKIQVRLHFLTSTSWSLAPQSFLASPLTQTRRSGKLQWKHSETRALLILQATRLGLDGHLRLPESQSSGTHVLFNARTPILTAKFPCLCLGHRSPLSSAWQVTPSKLHAGHGRTAGKVGSRQWRFSYC